MSTWIPGGLPGRDFGSSVDGPNVQTRRFLTKLLRMKKKLLLLAIALAVSFALAEFALRMAGLGRNLVYEYDEQLLWKLKPHQSAWAPSYGTGYTINARGWRDEDVPIDKPPGEFRVLALGDSVMFGQGVPEEQTLAWRLEDSLGQASPGGAQVINTGVAGYSVFHYLAFLETEGFDYEPDLVLLAFGKNDILSQQDLDVLRDHAERGLKFGLGTLGGKLRRRSAVFHALNGFWYRIESRWKPVPRALSYADPGASDDAWTYTLEALDRIAVITAERGVPLVFIVFPYQKEAVSGEVEASGPRLDTLRSRHEFHLVDLQPTFAAHAGEGLFIDPAHPSGLANGYAADRILAYLREHGLVPGSGRPPDFTDKDWRSGD